MQLGGSGAGVEGLTQALEPRDELLDRAREARQQQGRELVLATRRLDDANIPHDLGLDLALARRARRNAGHAAGQRTGGADEHAARGRVHG